MKTLTQDSGAAPQGWTPMSTPAGAGDSASDERAEIPPSLYQRFEAFQFLGRGGTGAVYRARDFRLGRDVAVKLLFGADPERGGSLLREARSQARVTHENVCEIHEAGVADHVRFIVMRLIDGAPLDRAKAEMTLEEQVRAIRQIASALHEAHQLGLIHRDVKPSNIMVERTEDGAWKPYIMDFGLAREAGDSGRTMTGALAGTPAFMAPEQADGKVRSLDRRTDVYGLGATLYDVLGGRPPFAADTLLSLLEQIRSEEPAPLRRVEPDIPRDLEAIVMKCLEKAPGARYASARALGEDLQRFLDGDPVMARRGALGYALLKRVRRHKAKAALAAAAIMAAAVVAGLWIRGRQTAAEQARLARELGEDVKEMELFLRSAHGMPLHDVERERDMVRARLRQIEARMAAAGEIGQGPGHYALGRGLLALHEAEAARVHLEKAAAAGYRSPGLDYAIGLALSALYEQELEETKRIQNAEQRAARVAELSARTRQPALRHLRAALGRGIEAPAYAEGLIALYEGRYDEALAKAREAFARAPWLHEAKLLEGDVLFALGSRVSHDASFDYDKTMHWFGQAAEAYRVAAEIGRSDPAVHEAACALWTQVMDVAFERREPVRPSFEKAKAACERAIAASSRSASAHVKLAAAHSAFAWRVTTGDIAGEDPDAALKEASARAEEAARKSPGDPMARYITGSVWRARALYASNRGLDVSPAVDRAIAGYVEALRLDPGFLWALNELCSSLTLRGRREARHGADPTGSVNEAISHCDRAIALDPSFMLPKAGKIVARMTLAERLVTTGRSPADAIRAALEVVDSAAAQSPDLRWVHYWRALLHRIEATYALEADGAAAPLEQAEASVKELERLQPSAPSTHQLRGEVALLRARWLAAHEQDPSPSLREARAALARAVEATPWDLGYRVWSANVEIAALRWALRHGQATGARFQAARAPLLPLLDVERADPSLYQALAEIHELRAGQGRGEAEEIAKGLQRVEEALDINPRMAPALACKGRLLLLRARWTAAPRDRREAATQAREALSAAMKHNPLLARSVGRALDEARRLAAP